VTVIVSGTIFFADQAARDGAVAASIDLQRATRTDEPGCLAYVFTADPVEPCAVHVYEAWTDEAALAAHFAHPNYTNMRAVLRAFPRGAASAVEKHDAVHSEPVYDSTGTPRADWFKR
jgi:quinol monooxygenase YgiN